MFLTKEGEGVAGVLDDSLIFFCSIRWGIPASMLIFTKEDMRVMEALWRESPSVHTAVSQSMKNNLLVKVCTRINQRVILP